MEKDYINGILLDGTIDMKAQVGIAILTKGITIFNIMDQKD